MKMPEEEAQEAETPVEKKKDWGNDNSIFVLSVESLL